MIQIKGRLLETFCLEIIAKATHLQISFLHILGNGTPCTSRYVGMACNLETTLPSLPCDLLTMGQVVASGFKYKDRHLLLCMAL